MSVLAWTGHIGVCIVTPLRVDVMSGQPEVRQHPPVREQPLAEPSTTGTTMSRMVSIRPECG